LKASAEIIDPGAKNLVDQTEGKIDQLVINGSQFVQVEDASGRNTKRGFCVVAGKTPVTKEIWLLNKNRKKKKARLVGSGGPERKGGREGPRGLFPFLKGRQIARTSLQKIEQI